MCVMRTSQLSTLETSKYHSDREGKTMDAQQSIEEMKEMLTAEGLLHINTCERCEASFHATNADDRVCEVCAGNQGRES